VSGAGVGAARLRVAVVEAAAAVVVRAVEDGVDPFRRVARRRARGVVVAVAGPGRDEDTVHLLPGEIDGRAGRGREVVVPVGGGALGGTAGRRLGEVVRLAGLVVDDRDHTAAAAAERVLRGGVGDTPGSNRRDVLGRPVRALDLVQGAVERAVERARRAVRGHAGRAAGCVDVARRGGDNGSRSHKGEETLLVEHGGWFGERVRSALVSLLESSSATTSESMHVVGLCLWKHVWRRRRRSKPIVTRPWSRNSCRQNSKRAIHTYPLCLMVLRGPFWTGTPSPMHGKRAGLGRQ
jgi:hypothetical protein